MLIKGDVYFNGIACKAVIFDSNEYVEVCLVLENQIRSAYKLVNGKEEYMFGSNHAREFYRVVKIGLTGVSTCKKKGIGSMPFELGIQHTYTFKKNKIDFTVCKFGERLVGISAEGDGLSVDLVYAQKETIIPKGIDYKLIRVVRDIDFSDGTEDQPPEIRTLDEIQMNGKDTSWLKTKEYHIVSDPATAENIFRYIEANLNKLVIAYDTETTGLKMNMFGKYGSKYRLNLEEHNRNVEIRNKEALEKGVSHEELEETIRADKLTGIILCWKPNVSYYFPVGHKYLQNLYDGEQGKSIDALRIVQTLRNWAYYHPQKDLSSYVRSVTNDEEFPCDVLLMQRVRKILEEGHIVAHNGAFEWKVSYIYDIILNLKDDTMILHQILYKFRNTTRNSGESSALKYLVGKEFGVDQLELTDFFVDYTEDTGGAVKSINGKKKKKKKGSNIDFSYMDYNSTLAYAPADGDFTLQLYLRYKHALLTEHPELQYIYNVEVIVASAIGYMEFNGHRIDEEKIEATRVKLVNECAEIEQKIRQEAGLKDSEELNLGSPAQMADLFFKRMSIPFKGEKPSVAKNVLKSYVKMKDKDGNPKYPAINLYSEWKNKDTLITKFFGNLPAYMYPGGFIFSSYGQISTATGRMSCKGPNAQCEMLCTEKVYLIA